MQQMQTEESLAGEKKKLPSAFGFFFCVKVLFLLLLRLFLFVCVRLFTNFQDEGIFTRKQFYLRVLKVSETFLGEVFEIKQVFFFKSTTETIRLNK